MGDRSGMSISADSPSDETLNRGPLALLLRRQYEFPFGINIVQFSIFFFRKHVLIFSIFCPLQGQASSGNSVWFDWSSSVDILCQ